LNNITKIIIPLFIISLLANVYFISGKGIVINRDERVINNNNNSQWQGQLLLNQWTAQGNKIEWKFLVVRSLTDLDRVTKLTIELNKLHPISSLYSKALKNTNGELVLLYPDIFTENKKAN
jgi:hypothetical protein